MHLTPKYPGNTTINVPFFVLVADVRQSCLSFNRYSNLETRFPAGVSRGFQPPLQHHETQWFPFVGMSADKLIPSVRLLVIYHRFDDCINLSISTAR